MSRRGPRLRRVCLGAFEPLHPRIEFSLGLGCPSHLGCADRVRLRPDPRRPGVRAGADKRGRRSRRG
eukprot:8050734-Alexandrium_andersonii.AAC.1